MGDGLEGSANADFAAARAKAARLREALPSLEHAGVESVLLRVCADACKLTYALRLSGDGVAEGDLLDHDAELRATLERVLDGPIADH
eukprot:11335034-Alexandrium_andersonii.AAC.1